MTRKDDYVGLLFCRGQPKCVHARACVCQVHSMPCGTCSSWRTSDFPVVWVLPGRRAGSMPPVVESSSVAVKHRDWKRAGLEWGRVNTSSVRREAAPHIPSLPPLSSLTRAGTASVLLTGLLASSAVSCLLGIISSLFSALESICSGSPFSGSISLLLTGSSHSPLSPSWHASGFLWEGGGIHYFLVCVSYYFRYSCTALVTLCCSYSCMDLSLPLECELLEGKDFISLIVFNLLYTAPGTMWEGKHLAQIV